MGITHEFIAVTESIPFADLYIHPLNPRAEAPEGEIDTLAANIRDLGLIQNLAGLRDTEGRIGIVAGGRRLRALARLRDDPRFAFVPVKLAPDADTAAIWAAAENHARADLHPADEIREYAALRERGATVAAIAIACGVTQAHVKRRLRLADFACGRIKCRDLLPFEGKLVLPVAVPLGWTPPKTRAFLAGC